MKYILPDANTIISLRQVKEIELLNKICVKDNLTVILSEKVKNEVNRKRIERELDIQNNTNLKCIKSTDEQYAIIQKKIYLNYVLNLGKGETEIFAIISSCLDKTFSDYLIITDDIQASEVSYYLNMKCCIICDFLKRGLDNKTITREKYLQIINDLKSFSRINQQRYTFCKQIIN